MGMEDQIFGRKYTQEPTGLWLKEIRYISTWVYESTNISDTGTLGRQMIKLKVHPALLLVLCTYNRDQLEPLY